MDGTNPVYVLIAIVALSLLMVVLTVTLAATGNAAAIVPLGGVVMPLLASLVGLKVELVKRQLNKRMDGVYQTLHDEVVEAKEEAARLRQRWGGGGV